MAVSSIRLAALRVLGFALGMAVLASNAPIFCTGSYAQETIRTQKKSFWKDALTGSQYFASVQSSGNNSGPSKVKELFQQRLATAREFAAMVTQRVKNAGGAPEELMEATRMLLEAELELCASDKERVGVLEKALAAAKENERFASGLSKTGQGRQTTALKAKVARLQIEIALEKARAKQAEQPRERSGSR